MSDKVTFYYNPMSRARSIHWMLEEVGAPYEVKLIDLRKGEQKTPAFLAKNPMGKLPVIEHRGVVVTEGTAIAAYLADAFPQAGLAPDVNDPARGTYYRWLFFAPSVFEPATLDQKFPRATTPPPSFIGHGDFESVLNSVEHAIRDGFLLKNRFTTADLALASQLGYALMTEMIPARASFKAYVNLCQDRPAFRRHLETADRLGL